MFDDNDTKYLLRRLARNEVVLFLGAGFSLGATNRLGMPLPLSKSVAADIWTFLNYDGEYDGTPLPDMYEAMLQEGVSFDQVREFLDARLLTRDVPSHYDSITAPYWYRIYTTNVDDILPIVYARSGPPRVEVLAFPDSEPRERDASLQRIQTIFLHGRLPCRPDQITFSIRQYARRSGHESPLYQQFVGDYATMPTIFIGTELNEPLFWQHIEARDQRRSGISERRPRSFLIAPKISPPKRSQLEPYNVVPVEGTTEDFLKWLESVRADLPDLEGVLRHTLPSVVALFELPPGRGEARTAFAEFGQTFHLVPTAMATDGDRSFFLLGATPRWEDIFAELDVPREITANLLSEIEGTLDSDDLRLATIALLGSAGCGKSTILRRLGVQLARNGRFVFLTNSEELPAPNVIRDALQALERRAVLLFDNGEVALTRLNQVVDAVRGLPNPPVLVIASRLNDYDRRSVKLESVTTVEHVEVPHLTRPEIVGIISNLESAGLLGRLQGLSSEERIAEFESRAKAGKQLLVAMREATSGRGFDDIIQNEFDSLPTKEAKLLYLTVALATDAGYRLAEQELVLSSQAAPAETLHTLNRNLRGIVLPTGAQNNLLLLRHRAIAGYMLDSGAPRSLVAEAYARLLPVLAAAKGRTFRSRSFGLYRDLVNHKEVYRRFEHDLEEARAVYESVAGPLRTEAQFWLQYGLLELEFGNLEFAENYLLQAESLYPESDLIRTSMGHLYLKRAVSEGSEAAAYELRRQGTEIMAEEMDGQESPYPFHVYCSQRFAFSRQWLANRAEFKQELEHLREVLLDGRRRFPTSKKLRGLSERIEREYLLLGVSR